YLRFATAASGQNIGEGCEGASRSCQAGASLGALRRHRTTLSCRASEATPRHPRGQGVVDGAPPRGMWVVRLGRKAQARKHRLLPEVREARRVSTIPEGPSWKLTPPPSNARSPA